MSHAPKQEPAHITTLALVLFSISSLILSEKGFNPSANCIQTSFAFFSFISFIVFSNSKLYYI